MRVLHVLDTSAPSLSGYAVRSHYILQAQRRAGLEPLGITSDRHDATCEMEQIDGITYYRSRVRANRLIRALGPRLRAIGFRDVLLMIRLYRDLVRLARERSIDVLHAHSPVLCGLPAWAAARRLKRPFVYEVRALWEDAAVDQEKTTERSPRYHVTRALETFVLRRADHIIVICEPLREEVLRRGIDPRKISVVPNGVDTTSFTPQTRRQEVLARYGLNGERVVGFIGTFFSYEGLATLVQAAPLLCARDPNIRILIVGGGEQEAALRRLVSERHLEDQVIFAGRVPHKQIQALYAVMDVLVYPRVSRRITELVSPLKPLEAMAMGKAVVASDVGGLRELIHDGQTGLLFRPGDSEALAQACLRLIEDRPLAERLGRQARAHVETKRGWEQVCAVYPSLYAQLTGASR